jgi:hypothetical protein
VCVNERTLVPISFKLPILVGYRVQCVCVNERTLVLTSIFNSLAWSDIGINMSMSGHLRISIKNRRKSISPKTTVKRQILFIFGVQISIATIGFSTNCTLQQNIFLHFLTALANIYSVIISVNK